MHKNVLKYILFFAISIVLILIDQYTKYLAKISLQNKPPYVVIKDVVELVYTENEGAAFGILQGKQWLFYGLTVIIIIAILIALCSVVLSFLLYCCHMSSLSLILTDMPPALRFLLLSFHAIS